MAVIGSIRKRSGLLIILIGMAILLFVLGDAFGGGAGVQGVVPEVGQINGESVSAIELESEANQLEALFASYGQSITPEQARRQAWSNMVRDRVYFSEIRESGFSVTTEEFDDLRWGESVMSEFTDSPNFKNAAGQFSPDSVQRLYASLYQADPGRYNLDKKRIQEARLTSKFNTLIGKSIFYNSIDGKDNAKGSNDKVSFQYVAKKFSTIPDSTLDVSDDRLMAYYNAHKNDKSLEQVESRVVDYINFTVSPTAEDEKLIYDQTLKMKSEWMEELQPDSNFILINSDNSAYSRTAFNGVGDNVIDSQIENGAVGTIAGPYKVGKQYKLAKIVGRTAPKEQAKVRHILLKTEDENTALRQKADSILSIIRADRNQFDALGAKFSEDNFQGNKGVYDWFDKGRMVAEFEDFSFDNDKGATGVVKTQFGYHIIEVLGKRNDQPEVVEFVMNIVPSSETSEIVYEEASNFAIDNATAAKFEEGAKAKGYKVESISNLSMSASSVGSVPNAREAVRWAFQDDRIPGEVKSFDLDENFMVVLYKAKKEKGTPSFESIKDIVKTEVLKEMKAEKIKASFAGSADLQAISSALGEKINDANEISFAASAAPGSGNEPKLIGTAFNVEEGQMSEPIVGNQGVYVLKVTSKTIAANEGVDVGSNQVSLMKQAETTVTSRIQSAMNKVAGVESLIDKVY